MARRLNWLRQVGLLLALGATSAVQAALPFGSLQFTEPVATVSADAVLDMWLTFTLDASSPALNLVPGDLSGFDAASLPTEGQYTDPTTQDRVTLPFDHLTGVFLNTYFVCDDTFSSGCNIGAVRAYDFTFHTDSTPGKPSLNFLNTFSLQPGESTTYVFGTFTPVGGVAPAGTYLAYGAGLTLNFEGLSADGQFLTATVDLARTCPNGNDSSCAFTREVTAVPEPQAAWMLGLGLAVVLLVRRRRLRH